MEKIKLIPTGVFLYQYLLKDLQLVSNETVMTFPFQLGVLKDNFERVLHDTFQIMFQTFLVTVADFFDVGHFALFSLFLLQKLCTVFQFNLFEKRNIQLSWSDVFVSPITQNI